MAVAEEGRGGAVGSGAVRESVSVGGSASVSVVDDRSRQRGRSSGRQVEVMRRRRMFLRIRKTGGRRVGLAEGEEV